MYACMYAYSTNMLYNVNFIQYLYDNLIYWTMMQYINRTDYIIEYLIFDYL